MKELSIIFFLFSRKTPTKDYFFHTGLRSKARGNPTFLLVWIQFETPPGLAEIRGPWSSEEIRISLASQRGGGERERERDYRFAADEIRKSIVGSETIRRNVTTSPASLIGKEVGGRDRISGLIFVILVRAWSTTRKQISGTPSAGFMRHWSGSTWFEGEGEKGGRGRNDRGMVLLKKLPSPPYFT